MAATTEDAVTIAMPVTVVPAYEPSNPYSVLDTLASGYDQLVIGPTQNSVVVPPRGY